MDDDDTPETPTPETPISYCLVDTPERDTPGEKEPLAREGDLPSEEEEQNQNDEQDHIQIVNEDHTSEGRDDETDQIQNGDDGAIEMHEYMSRAREDARAEEEERTELIQTPGGGKRRTKKRRENRADADSESEPGKTEEEKANAKEDYPKIRKKKFGRGRDEVRNITQIGRNRELRRHGKGPGETAIRNITISIRDIGIGSRARKPKLRRGRENQYHPKEATSRRKHRQRK